MAYVVEDDGNQIATEPPTLDWLERHVALNGNGRSGHMMQSTMSRQPDIDILPHRAGEPHTAQRQAPSRERATILIVDDEPSIVELLALVLEEAGYEVLTAANGWAGLILSKIIRPELVLTDYTMPECNGAQLARELRRHRATRDIPVVLMSATRPSRAELHGVPFLAKPFDLDEVIEVVAQYVDVAADKPLV